MFICIYTYTVVTDMKTYREPCTLLYDDHLVSYSYNSVIVIKPKCTMT